MGLLVRALGRLCWQMTVVPPPLRSHFWRLFIDTARHNPAALEFVLILAAFYLHLGPYSARVIQELDRQIAACGHDELTAPGAIRQPMPTASMVAG